MNTRVFNTLFLVLCTVIFLGATMVQASALKDRMTARLPAVTKLKNSGVIGETSKGYLDFVGSDRAEAALINEENTDRETVYAAIAKQEGVTTLLVGQRRAQMLLDKAAKGQWFQKPDGQWFQK